MKYDFQYQSGARSFDADFGRVINATDGGFERGYAAGYTEGEQTAKAAAEAHNAEILTDCNSVLQTKGASTADTLEQVPQRIGEIVVAGASGIYMAKVTPAEDVEKMSITHNLGTTDILLAAAWAETLGDVTPAANATVAKFWAKTEINTQRGGNGFGPGYAWNVTNSYAANAGPNVASYETLTITDENNVSLNKTSSGSVNMYLAGVTYTVIIIAANAFSDMGV